MLFPNSGGVVNFAHFPELMTRRGARRDHVIERAADVGSTGLHARPQITSCRGTLTGPLGNPNVTVPEGKPPEQLFLGLVEW
jgi:hypothetical protein